MLVISVVIAQIGLKLFGMRIWKIEKDSDTPLLHQRGFYGHTDSILVGSTGGGHFDLFTVEFERAVDNPFPQVDLLMRLGQVIGLYDRTIGLGHL